MLSDKQQRRAAVLTKLSAGEMDVAQASALLGLSERQVRRSLARLQSEGLCSLVHGNSGRTPHNKTPEVVRQRLAEIARGCGEYGSYGTCRSRV